MSLSLFILPLLIFFCFIKLPISGLGSFLVIDFISLLYFLIKPNHIIPNLVHLQYLFIGVIGGFLSLLSLGVNEFSFLARIGLVYIDACFLAVLVKRFSAPLARQLVIRQAFFGYIAAVIIWSIAPESMRNIFYFDVIKAWVATFPCLIVVYYLVVGAYKHALVVALIVFAFSLHPEIISRTLMLQSLLFVLYAGWGFNKKLALMILAVVFVLGLALSNISAELIDNQAHSNTFRLVMIAQILDFSVLEWLFGRGIYAWQASAHNELYNLPGASEFFEAANPHFFPAELIIRGGLSFFVGVVLVATSSMRRSPYRWIVLCMFIGSFTTTNTGVERLYFSLALCLVLVRPVKVRQIV